MFCRFGQLEVKLLYIVHVSILSVEYHKVASFELSVLTGAPAASAVTAHTGDDTEADQTAADPYLE